MTLPRSSPASALIAETWPRHPVIAGLTGFLAGGFAIALVDWLGRQWIGQPDHPQPDTIATRIHILGLAAWVLGAGLAGIVATVWNGGRRLVPGLAAASALMAGSVATMFAVPHPDWMVVAAVMSMPAAGWLGTRSRIVSRASPGRR